MKSKKAIPFILFGLVAALAITAVIAPFGEKEWRSEVVHEGNPDFVQLEIVNGEPRVAFSSDQGITLAKRKSGFLSEDSWKRTRVTNRSDSGFYLSMKEIDGKLAMAHQYSGLGNRKLGYTRKVNGSWETKEIDSQSGTGLEAGMYASLTHLNSDPVILYHTAENDQFTKARKSDGAWNKELLQRNTGQFISTDSCGEKVHAIYRSRENSSLHHGTLSDDGWVTEKLDGDTDAVTSVDATNCEFRGAFHNTLTGQVTYIENEKTEKVAPGKFSRLSLEKSEDLHISYYNYGRGLFHASRGRNGWSSQPVDTAREYAGERNDLDLYRNGDPAIAYTTDSQVVFTEYRKGEGAELNFLLRILTLLLTVPAVLSLLHLEEELLLLKSKLFKQLRL